MKRKKWIVLSAAVLMMVLGFCLYVGDYYRASEDLTRTGLQVCSLYGDRDGVLNLEKYAQYRSNLPEDTQEQILEGGNHAGFGSYGHQEGDGESQLDAGAQIQWTADRILSFILG